MLLRDNRTARGIIKGKLDTVFSNLLDLDDFRAEVFADWCKLKSNLYHKALLNKKYQRLPNNLQRGDIVLCELGINVPPEFGNDGTGRHFVVIWAQQGHNFIVIPITKQEPPPTNKHTIPLGNIPGMPAHMNFAKLDAIRTVSIRRLGRIVGIKEGKITDNNVRQKINKSMLELFIDK